MDLFGRFRKLDSSLQRGLDNGFARVFGGEVVPAEIDELLKQEAEDALMEDRDGAYHAPSTYLVHVSARDHEALLSDRPTLDHDLRDRLQRFIRNEGWSTSGPVTVDIVKDESLHTGQLKSRSWFDAADATATDQGARRPAPQQSRPAPEASRAPSPQRWSELQRDQAGSAGSSGSAPEWPRSGPDSGRNPVAQAYDADHADGQPSQGGTYRPAPDDRPAESDRSSSGSAASAASAGSAAAAAGAGGALAGLAHPRAESPRPGTPQNGSQNPPSIPGTEVFSDQHAQAPVAGAEDMPGAQPGQPLRTVTLFLRDGSDRTYVLTQGSNVIGRGNAVDFRLPDTGVSRQHVDIAWDGYDAVLTDLKSTNGTTVNETPVENWLLADGDVIVIGHSEIEVRIS
jgi:hypothetical protein